MRGRGCVQQGRGSHHQTARVDEKALPVAGEEANLPGHGMSHSPTHHLHHAQCTGGSSCVDHNQWHTSASCRDWKVLGPTQQSCRAPHSYQGPAMLQERSHTFCGHEVLAALTSKEADHRLHSNNSVWYTAKDRGSSSSSSNDLSESISLPSTDCRNSLSHHYNVDEKRYGWDKLRHALSSFSLCLQQGQSLHPMQRILRPLRPRQTMRGLSGLTIDGPPVAPGTASVSPRSCFGPADTKCVPTPVAPPENESPRAPVIPDTDRYHSGGTHCPYKHCPLP